MSQAELQTLIPKNKINAKIRSKDQDRFSQSSKNEVAQPGLVKFMNDSIDSYAAEIPGSTAAVKTTQTMIFTVIRMFNNLYSQGTNK